jgi:Cys-tRNA(Pro) deacylase
MSMNLEGFLKAQGVPFEFVEKKSTVHTVDAASATGIPLERITKSLVVLGEGGAAYVAVIPGTHRTRLKEVARAVGEKKVRLCPFEDAHKFSGYPPGATPPVNHQKVKAVVVDDALRQWEEIYGGGGTNERLVKLRTEDVIRLNGGLTGPISEPPAPGNTD